MNVNVHKIEQYLIALVSAYLATHAGSDSVSLSIAVIAVGLLVAHSTTARMQILADTLKRGVGAGAADAQPVIVQALGAPAPGQTTVQK